MRLRCLLFLCVSATSGWGAALKTYSPSDVPNPMLDPTACGRSNVPKSAICDPSLLLDVESKNVIEGYINAIYNAQVAVAVVSEISANFAGKDDSPAASERFARELHENWGVGDKTRQDGILVFLSINDRVVYISTGSGVQRQLTKQFIDYIISDMKPDLKLKEYGKALERAVTQISLTMSGKSDIAGRISADENGGYLYGMMIATFVVGAGGWALYKKRELDQLRKGRQALDTFMKEVGEAEETKNFLSASCPICLEDFSVCKTPPEPIASEILESQRNNHLDHETNYRSVSSSDDFDEQSAASRRDAESGVGGQKDKNGCPKRAMALRCGHVYCHACLSEFLKSAEGTKCPICRAPVSGEAPRPPPPRPPSGRDGPGGGPSGGMGGYGGQSCSDSFYQQSDYSTRSYDYQQAEYRYRLNRMHNLYPGVMTGDTLMALNAALSTGSSMEFRRAAMVRSAEVTRTITAIESRNAAASSGSGGSSSSFGGGFSSGGGGGSW